MKRMLPHALCEQNDSVSNSLRGRECVLCRRGVSGIKGEHVLPSWFLGEWDSAPRPFVTSLNDEPRRKRDGAIREHASLARFQLPMCPRCNNILSERFEKRETQRIVSRMFRGEGHFSSTECRIAGTWTVKTWLLLAHPDTRASDPGWTTASGAWNPMPRSLLDWMIEGSPPPDGLSIWLAKMTPALGWEPPHVMDLPRVKHDGTTTDFQVFEFGVKDIGLTLVYHPGWPIEHPFEHSRWVRRFWPHNGKELKMETLLWFPRDAIRWRTGPRLTFHDGLYGSRPLPPIESSMEWMDLMPEFVSQITR